MLLFVGCNAGGTNNGGGNGGTTGTTGITIPQGLVGRWLQSGTSDFGLEIKSNGEIYQWSGDTYYQLQGKITRITATELDYVQEASGIKITYKESYELSGDTLTLTTGSGSATYKYQRL